MVQPVSSFSGRSMGVGGVLHGRIESIDDPEKRNRVQVRLFGYQDDQSGIPKENLEWIHVSQHNSQIAGATSTQPYYPGAQVVVLEAGSERFVMGGVPGFDSEKKLQNNPSGADTSQNKKSDTPNKQRGETGESSIRSSPGLVDSVKGLSQYFGYGNWQSMVKKIFPYSIGKGEKPAPWGEGTQAKFDALKTIGLDKLSFGSDVLDVIKQLDGNASGSIKSALDIIKNFRNNGFGTASSVIGSGPLGQADSQYVNTFGAQIQYNILSLLNLIIEAISFMKTLNTTNIYTVCNDGSLISTLAVFNNVTLNVSQTSIDAMTTSISSIVATGTTSTTSLLLTFYQTQLNILNTNFQSLVLQSITAIIELMITLVAQATDMASYITLLGGTDTFTQICQALITVCTYANISKDSLNTLCFGAITAALNGSAPVVQSPSGSSGSNSMASMMANMSKFLGNSIALKELMSGQKVLDTLTKTKRKYRGNTDPNHPNNDIKKFPDGSSSDAGTTTTSSNIG